MFGTAKGILAKGAGKIAKAAVEHGKTTGQSHKPTATPAHTTAKKTSAGGEEAKKQVFSAGLSNTQRQFSGMAPAMRRMDATGQKSGSRDASQYSFHKAKVAKNAEGKTVGVTGSLGHAAGGVDKRNTVGPLVHVDKFHSLRGKPDKNSEVKFSRTGIPKDAPYERGVQGSRMLSKTVGQRHDIKVEKGLPDTVVVIDGNDNFEDMKKFIAERHPPYYQAADSSEGKGDAINCVLETRDMILKDLETRGGIFPELREKLESATGDTSVAELSEMIEQLDGQAGVHVYRKGEDFSDNNK